MAAVVVLALVLALVLVRCLYNSRDVGIGICMGWSWREDLSAGALGDVLPLLGVILAAVAPLVSILMPRILVSTRRFSGWGGTLALVTPDGCFSAAFFGSVKVVLLARKSGRSFLLSLPPDFCGPPICVDGGPLPFAIFKMSRDFDPNKFHRFFGLIMEGCDSFVSNLGVVFSDELISTVDVGVRRCSAPSNGAAGTGAEAVGADDSLAILALPTCGDFASIVLEVGSPREFLKADVRSRWLA